MAPCAVRSPVPAVRVVTAGDDEVFRAWVMERQQIVDPVLFPHGPANRGIASVCPGPMVGDHLGVGRDPGVQVGGEFAAAAIAEFVGAHGRDLLFGVDGDQVDAADGKDGEQHRDTDGSAVAFPARDGGLGDADRLRHLSLADAGVAPCAAQQAGDVEAWHGGWIRHQPVGTMAPARGYGRFWWVGEDRFHGGCPFCGSCRTVLGEGRSR